MSVTVDVSGLLAHAARLRLAAAGIAVQAAAIIHAGAEDVVRDAKARCEVDRGDVRDSIGVDYSDGGLTAVIGPTDPGAPYLEYGTSRQAPEPFMRPAFEPVQDRVRAELAIVAARALL